MKVIRAHRPFNLFTLNHLQLAVCSLFALQGCGSSQQKHTSASPQRTEQNGSGESVPSSDQKNAREQGAHVGTWYRPCAPDNTLSEEKLILSHGTADVEPLQTEYKVLGIRKNQRTLSIQRNGCDLSKLPHRNYDIIAVHNDRLKLGIYVDEQMSFDLSGGTTPELRNNTMNSNSLVRLLNP